MLFEVPKERFVNHWSIQIFSRTVGVLIGWMRIHMDVCDLGSKAGD
uniref:Uncharacterized protein n=1 Tax=Anguilla anguilla TaxID=7936 RepID=A0A0E9ULV0_ANGAN